MDVRWQLRRKACFGGTLRQQKSQMCGVAMKKHTFNAFSLKNHLTQAILFFAVVGGLLLLGKATALDATGICKQQTIFGLVGTKSCVGQDDGSGTVPAATNLATVDTLPTMPAQFNSTAPTTDLTKVCSTQALLGSNGTAACSARASLMHADKNSSSLGRLVPKVKDDDGEGGPNVTKFNRTGLKVCGTTATTLSGKITDCNTQNAAASRWLGSNGNSGHGNWTLVMASNGVEVDGDPCVGIDPANPPNPPDPARVCKEIWRDDRTGLLWSDRLATDQNWCKASGANLGTVCSNTTNQPSPPESLCAEDGTRNTSNTYNVAKGNMLLGSANQKVRWWLPTRYDWMEAEENGIRFVLPNITANFWTSSADSANLTQAWIFKNAAGAGGALDTLDMLNETTSTRCIGQAIP